MATVMCPKCKKDGRLVTVFSTNTNTLDTKPSNQVAFICNHCGFSEIYQVEVK